MAIQPSVSPAWSWSPFLVRLCWLLLPCKLLAVALRLCTDGQSFQDCNDSQVLDFDSRIISASVNLFCALQLHASIVCTLDASHLQRHNAAAKP